MDNLLSIKAYASREAVPIMQDEGCDFICDYIKEHNYKNILLYGFFDYIITNFPSIAPSRISHHTMRSKAFT